MCDPNIHIDFNIPKQITEQLEQSRKLLLLSIVAAESEMDSILNAIKRNKPKKQKK